MNEFDFGEHFVSLIQECEGEFRFRGATAKRKYGSGRFRFGRV